MPEPPDRESPALAATRASDSDELACQLAYECGWRLCGDALQTLESQRTRAVALLSVTLVAAGLAVSSFARGDELETLGCLGIAGLAVCAVGALAVAGCAAKVAWPITADNAFLPSKIIANYVTPRHKDRSSSWVYRNLARDLEDAYNKMNDGLRMRHTFYKWAVVCVSLVVLGAAMLGVDAFIL